MRTKEHRSGSKIICTGWTRHVQIAAVEDTPVGADAIRQCIFIQGRKKFGGSLLV